MDDLISRQAAIDALTVEYMAVGILGEQWAVSQCIDAIKQLPSAEPDFSCDGCLTPDHICGICMRNYTDHYCTGEAWREAKDE